MWNIFRESRNTRNWFRYETFYYLFEFKVFRHEERERHNFFLSWLFYLAPTTCGTFRRPQLVSPWRDQKSTTFLETRISTNCRFFFKFKNPQRFWAWRHLRSRSHFLFGVFIVTSLIACVNTWSQCVHITNPCTKRKVLSLTNQNARYIKRNPSVIILHCIPLVCRGQHIHTLTLRNAKYNTLTTKNIQVKYKLTKEGNFKNFLKVNQECDIGVGFDNGFKTDNNIMSFV